MSDNNNKTFDEINNGQIFYGHEKFYTFNIMDHLNIKYDICYHDESFKDLQNTYLSHNNMKNEEKN